ncbi:hypothetical protein EDB84DRAFT_1473901 [Lactarius hengduanensis]|nr:hypothetical protein EDB84DRAFT_1473901 [Lactarius hengduanensis]
MSNDSESMGRFPSLITGISLTRFALPSGTTGGLSAPLRLSLTAILTLLSSISAFSLSHCWLFFFVLLDPTKCFFGTP